MLGANKNGKVMNEPLLICLLNEILTFSAVISLYIRSEGLEVSKTNHCLWTVLPLLFRCVNDILGNFSKAIFYTHN